MPVYHIIVVCLGLRREQVGVRQGQLARHVNGHKLYQLLLLLHTVHVCCMSASVARHLVVHTSSAL